jgi:glutathione S-transferase
MLSSVLRSPRAIQANIHIMRAFVRLRRLLIAQEELAQRLEAMEKKYDKQIAVILRVLDELMEPPALPGGKIGFAPPECEPEGEAE